MVLIVRTKAVVGQSDYSPSALTVAAAQASTQATCSPDSRPELYEKTLETLAQAQREFKALLGDDGNLLYVTLSRTAPSHYAALFEFTNVCCPMVMNYLGAPVTQVPTGLHEGLPYGIRVAATPHNDRLTIAVARELERLFGGWIKPCDITLNDRPDETKRVHSLHPTTQKHIMTDNSPTSAATAAPST